MNTPSRKQRTSSDEKPVADSTAAQSLGTHGELLEQYRGYLWAIAYAHLDRKLQGRLDASDIVQQTLLRAHSGFGDLRDHSPAIVAAWLRQILASEITDALRHFHRDKRDVDREQSMAAAIDQSAAGLEHWIAADQT